MGKGANEGWDVKPRQWWHWAGDLRADEEVPMRMKAKVRRHAPYCSSNRTTLQNVLTQQPHSATRVLMAFAEPNDRERVQRAGELAGP